MVFIGNNGGFEAFRCGMARGATDMEKLLLCIPRISKAMAGKEEDENERQGWLYQHDMIIKWLTGTVNRDAKTDNNPFWIDWDWVMKLKEYFPFPVSLVPTYPKKEYMYFVTPFPEIQPDPSGILSIEDMEPISNIYNTKAKRTLGKILARNKWPADFDFTGLPWTEWQDKYHTHRIVPQPTGVNGQQAALGSFTLRALARGETKKIGEWQYKVRVTGMAVFVYDVFNFEAGGIEWLGRWNCEKGDVTANFLDYINDEKLPPSDALPPPPGYVTLRNVDFRNYQNRYGLGHDYLVFSHPHMVENFKGIEYDYPL